MFEQLLKFKSQWDDDLLIYRYIYFDEQRIFADTLNWFDQIICQPQSMKRFILLCRLHKNETKSMDIIHQKSGLDLHPTTNQMAAVFEVCEADECIVLDLRCSWCRFLENRPTDGKWVELLTQMLIDIAYKFQKNFTDGPILCWWFLQFFFQFFQELLVDAMNHLHITKQDWDGVLIQQFTIFNWLQKNLKNTTSVKFDWHMSTCCQAKIMLIPILLPPQALPNL